MQQKQKFYLENQHNRFTLRSNQAYNRRIAGEGEIYKQRMQSLVTCPNCPTVIQSASLPQHVMSIHNMFYKHDRRIQIHEMISNVPQTYTIDAPRKTSYISQTHIPT
jgi:hypothetical protein